MRPSLALPTVADIRSASDRIAHVLPPTPLIGSEPFRNRAGMMIKAECLQPTGSFKVRGAGNALLRSADVGDLVYTASAGNMALALAWHARRLGIRAAAIVPDSAPVAKKARIAELGGVVHEVPFDVWWRTMVDGGHPDFSGTFVHPFCDADVVAGNGVIGLEIAEQAPACDAVVVPFGGGGLALGIQLGLRAAGCDVPVYAAEIATAAPLAVALAAGRPVEPDREPSFVDGIGGRAVFGQIWPHVQTRLAGSVVVSVSDAAAATRDVLRDAKVLLEGAGATAVAAARKLAESYGSVVAVGSGGNVDADVVARIVSGANA